MNWAVRLRFAGMPWVAGIFSVVALVFASEQLPGSVDYPLAVTSTAVASTALVAPLAAAVAAWAGWRLGRGRNAFTAGVRPAWRLTAGVVGPVAAGAVAALVATAVVRLSLAGLSPLPDPGAIVVAVFVVVGLTSAGFAVGTVMPGLVAAPLTMVASYVWLTFPLTLNTLWVRQLTGMWLDCCLSDEELRPAAVAAVLILYSAITLAAVAVVRWRWVRRGERVALVWAGLSMTVGVLVPPLMVVGTGPYPSQPRTDPLTCADGVVRTCVWPEHAGELPRVAAAAAEVAGRLDALAAVRPSTLSEANPARVGEGTGVLGVVRGMSDQDLESSVAVGMSPALLPSCEQSLSSRGMAGVRLFADVTRAQGLVLARAGVSGWQERIGPDQAAFVRELLRRSDHGQGAWINSVTQRARDCAAGSRTR